MMAKIKIAFIVGSFPTLSETFILNQITGLLERGYQVEIFAKRKKEESKIHQDIEEYNLINHTHYQPDIPRNKFHRIIKGIGLIIPHFHKHPRAIIDSLNIFKYGKEALTLQLLYIIIPFLAIDEDYDIICCHFGTNGNRAVKLKKLGFLKGKIITTFHGYDVRIALKQGAHMYKRLFENGDLFLAGTEYNYEKFIEFGLEESKIVRHPVGINLDIFPYKWDSVPDKSLGVIKLITVGRLEKEKGLEYGIKAFAKLKKQNKDLDLEYKIIGDGSLFTELSELIKTLNVQGSVTLMGAMNQEEIQKELKKNHIFILPSVAESFGVVLLEAQTTGLPVVATDVGSVDQAVVNGESAYLVQSKNVDSLVDKLQYLVENPDKWPSMGKIGRKYVEENYNIEKLNDRLIDIFQKLLNGTL